MSWADNLIQLGTGVVVGDNVKVSKQDTDDQIQVNAASFSANIGVTPQFRFPWDESGKMSMIHIVIF